MGLYTISTRPKDSDQIKDRWSHLNFVWRTSIMVVVQEYPLLRMVLRLSPVVTCSVQISVAEIGRAHV